MSGTAILCSGQGSQGPHMFDLVAAEPAAAPIFAAAAHALAGQDPRELARQGGDVIHRNHIAQVLCCAQALAAWAVLGTSTPRPLTIAGYSAGEVPAWVVAGLIAAPTAFDLVTRRAALMDAETHEPSGLAAIVGLTRDVIDGVCRLHKLDVAIVNGPAHFIVGGHVADIDAALAEAAGRGASRAVRLPIGVASHTPALRRASEQFAGLLRDDVQVGARLPPGVRLISGIDGAPVRDIGNGLAKLAAQISTTVNWAACMEACRGARPTRILELGPGDALARMMSECAPDIRVHSVADFRTVDGVRRWMEEAS
ncbi:acyltransferase domain-containing protein [Xanthobacter sp. DSM 24535]|uniref:acyltransferase domain-containing protein n=1 Tax=Roseixanthobacter psychrophilus TaxID=3119917 RepID=UPI0037284510